MDITVLKEFIKPELLILVPVIYLIGVALKKSESISDKYIPLCLGLVGIMLSIMWVLSTSNIGNWQELTAALFIALTQGVLTAGCSVYVNQIIKQSKE